MWYFKDSKHIIKINCNYSNYLELRLIKYFEQKNYFISIDVI